MKTYEDLKDVNDGGMIDFVRQCIAEHKSSRMYSEAKDAYDYFRRKNVTINRYIKLLYTMSGEAVPDNFSANYKFANAFFQIFVLQENSYLLGNGVTFNNDETKDRIGGPLFDNELMRAGEAALWGGVSFGFMNFDHLEVFDVLEFVPLFGEEDGRMHAGIRFWQIDKQKPMRATLYEEDGYTDFIWKNGSVGEILNDKRPYIITITSSEADGEEIKGGRNYPGLPIVPLWGSPLKQSELVGIQEKIDGYDLIQSGFANDLDDASQIYWTIKNAGGMDDVDLAKFVERLKTVKAAVVDDSGSQAEAHTVDVPYQARQQALENIRDSLYRDAMALDTDKISAGNVTATAIFAAYQNLDLKCDRYEMCVTDFIMSLLRLLELDDVPTYKRTKVVNMDEITTMILSAKDYLDRKTILKHLPFVSPDEIDEIMIRKAEEDAGIDGVPDPDDGTKDA